MQHSEITFFDRYQKKACTEKVYGDKYLRWTYGTWLGKIALAAVVSEANQGRSFTEATVRRALSAALRLREPEFATLVAGSATGGSATVVGNEVQNVTADGRILFSAVWDFFADGFSNATKGNLQAELVA